VKCKAKKVESRLVSYFIWSLRARAAVPHCAMRYVLVLSFVLQEYINGEIPAVSALREKGMIMMAI
jgi:hypothetical protein